MVDTNLPQSYETNAHNVLMPPKGSLAFLSMEMDAFCASQWISDYPGCYSRPVEDAKKNSSAAFFGKLRL